MFKKKYNVIMSGFIQAKKELIEYCKQESKEQGKQEELARAATKSANKALENKSRAYETINKLDTILGN